MSKDYWFSAVSFDMWNESGALATFNKVWREISGSPTYNLSVHHILWNDKRIVVIHGPKESVRMRNVMYRTALVLDGGLIETKDIDHRVLDALRARREKTDISFNGQSYEVRTSFNPGMEMRLNEE